MTALRAIVVDDSPAGRQTLADLLEEDGQVQVVARAQDGDEALKQVFEHAPDLLTLDLEMPRMDGFTFLRILMNRRPTPVLVVSSHGRRENVFKALELGALDFIAKPARLDAASLKTFGEELRARVRLVRQLRVVPMVGDRPRRPAATPSRRSPPDGVLPVKAKTPARREPSWPRVIAIGASTGGPPALQQIFSSLQGELPAAVLVAQHMPAKFTRTFAERLDRVSAVEVREAADKELLRPGLALVCPGHANLTVERMEDRLRVRVTPAHADDRYVPSIDRLFKSAAELLGPDLLAVVLTGMGGDGGEGIKAVHLRGGQTVAESAETAVIFGMPQEAIASGGVDQILPLGDIAEHIHRFAWRR